MAYEDPWKMCDVDRRIYGMENPGYSRKEILQIWGKYVDMAIEENPKVKWPTFIKPIIFLFKDEQMNATYRRLLSDSAIRKKFDKFSELIDYVIEEYGKKNPEAMNERPPQSKE